MPNCSVFGQPLARGARCSDRDCPQHGLPEGGRNYVAGTILIRHTWSGWAFLVVESIQERPSQSAIMLRHEDGHREFVACNTSIPIERALFGYRVATSEEVDAGVVIYPESTT